MAGRASALPAPLHPHQRLVAESAGALVRRDQPAGAFAAAVSTASPNWSRRSRASSPTGSKTPSLSSGPRPPNRSDALSGGLNLFPKRDTRSAFAPVRQTQTIGAASAALRQRSSAARAVDADLIRGSPQSMAARLLSAVAGRGTTAQVCTHCRYAQTAGRDLQRCTAPPTVRYHYCLSPAAAVTAMKRGTAEVVLTKNGSHGGWFVHQGSLTPRPRVHRRRSRAPRSKERWAMDV